MDPKVTQGPSTAKAVIHLLHPLMLQLHMPQLAQRMSPVTHLTAGPSGAEYSIRSLTWPWWAL